MSKNTVVALADVRGAPAEYNRNLFCLECAKEPEWLADHGVADVESLVEVTLDELLDDIRSDADYPSDEAQVGTRSCEACGMRMADIEVWEDERFDRVVTYDFLASAIFNDDRSSFQNHVEGTRSEDSPWPGDNTEMTDDDVTLRAFYDYIGDVAVVDLSFNTRYYEMHDEFGEADHACCTRNHDGVREMRYLRGRTIEILIERAGNERG